MTQQVFVAFLNSSILISADNKDCLRYLNNRLSTDLKALAIGSGTFSAALSAQGKTEAFLYVLRTGAESYLLLADGGDSSNIIQALSRFKVRDQIDFQDQSLNYQVLHLFQQPTSISLDSLLQKIQDISKNEKVYLIKRNRFGAAGIDIISLRATLTAEEVLSILPAHTLLSEPEQKLLRLKAFIPKFPEDLGPDFLLQESGLQAAYSVSKGCYVGQEVIQKISSFASTPAKLLGFTVAGNHRQEETPTLEPETNQKIGSILSMQYETSSNLNYGLIRINTKYLNDFDKMRGFLGTDMLSFTSICDFTAT